MSTVVASHSVDSSGGKKVSLAVSHPHLVAEWADDRAINEVTAGSAYAAKWSCPDGHHQPYQQSVSSKAKGQAGCLVCNGYHVLVGYNDLLTMHPELSSLWADSRSMTAFSPGSKKEAWWKCNDYDHEYSAKIVRVVGGYRCTYCSGRRILQGFNDLLTTHPHLAEEWVDEKRITEVSRGQQYKALWECRNCSLQWRASILHRSRGRGCPYCAGMTVEVGRNDLATTHPHLAKEWADENKSVIEVTKGSEYSALWKCCRGHTWRAAVYNRTGSLNAGCPVCSGNTVLAGYNDLATTHPEYVLTWADSREMTTASAGSSYIAEWKCVNDRLHPKWKARVYSRVSQSVDFGCPRCSGHISYPEHEILSFVRSLGFDDAERNRSVLSGKELDIYVPSRSFAIEYNGLYWHSEATGKSQWDHYEKWELCKQAGVELLVVWEDDWRERSDVIKAVIANKLLGGTGASIETVGSVHDSWWLQSIESSDEIACFYQNNSVQHLRPRSRLSDDDSAVEATSFYDYFLRADSSSGLTDDFDFVIGAMSLVRRGYAVEILSFCNNVFTNNVGCDCCYHSEDVFSQMMQKISQQSWFANNVNMVTMTTSNDTVQCDYSQHGFEVVRTLGPQAWLTKKNFRVKIENNKNEFVENQSRIWNYGYQVWEKKII